MEYGNSYGARGYARSSGQPTTTEFNTERGIIITDHPNSSRGAAAVRRH